MANNLSIHPRTQFGSSGEKLNTSKRPSKERLLRVKGGIEAHLERHPSDGASRQLLAKIVERLAGGTAQ
jgi:ribosomal protein S15P/S13E